MTQQKMTIAEQISYNPDTGEFHWLVDLGSRAKAGELAGYINEKGYRVIAVGGYNYKAHRLAFYLVKGYWPKNPVDHKNTIKSDNRWDNLREATHSQNQANRPCSDSSTTGYKGVFKFRDKFKAALKKDGKIYYLGLHSTAEKAAVAYDNMALTLFGEFAYLNFGSG